uniref:E3 ubiquitin-protein ligase listerin n=1 Tax=Schistocephalus solidus TaxID=70667 RepID=A0A0X3PNI6_SCHSO
MSLSPRLKEGMRKTYEHLRIVCSRSLSLSVPFQVVVSWTFCAVDAYENTARAAQRGLKETFPGKKLGELFRHFAKPLLLELERRLDDLKCLPSLIRKAAAKFSKKETVGSGSTTLMVDQLPPECHCHLNTSVQVLLWLNSFIGELALLPESNPELGRFRSLIGVQSLWQILQPLLLTVRFGVLESAYYRLLSSLCQSSALTTWMLLDAEGGLPLFNFLMERLLREMRPSADHLAATISFLSAFETRVWQEVDWRQTVSQALLPLLEAAETKAERKAIFSSLLPLVSHLPLDFHPPYTETDMTLLLHLVETALFGLLRSLGLKATDDLSSSILSKDERLPPLLTATDQGSAVDCLVGLFELTRFLIDAVALADPQHIFTADLLVLDTHEQPASSRDGFLRFLIRQVVFLLLDVSLLWEPAQMSKRWISRDQFFAAIFDQVSKLTAHLARSDTPSLSSLYILLRDHVTGNLIVNGSLRVRPRSLLSFIDSLACSAKKTDSSNGYRLDRWCNVWFLELFTLLRPKETFMAESELATAHLWLLALALLGCADAAGQAVDGSFPASLHPFDLLLSHVLPLFSKTNAEIGWSHPMTLAVAKLCSFTACPAFEEAAWRCASPSVRKLFITMPFAGLCADTYCNRLPPNTESAVVEAIGCLASVVTSCTFCVKTILEVSMDYLVESFELYLSFFKALFSNGPPLQALEGAKQQTLDSLAQCLSLSLEIDSNITLLSASVLLELRSLLSSLLLLLKPSSLAVTKTSIHSLVRLLTALTLDLIWRFGQSVEVQQILTPSLGQAIMAYATSSDDALAPVWLVWTPILERLRIAPPQATSPLLLALCSHCLKVDEGHREDWSYLWLSALIDLLCELCSKDWPTWNPDYALCPRFLQPENGLLSPCLLGRLERFLVCLQLGLRLRLQDEFSAPSSIPHRRLFCVLSLLRVWLAGLMEHAELPKSILLPPSEETLSSDQQQLPPSHTLLSSLNLVFAQIAQSYSLTELCTLLTDPSALADLFPEQTGRSAFLDCMLSALRAGLTSRLLATHPMDWPPEAVRPASCTTASPDQSWLGENLLPLELGGLGVGKEVFRLLTEVYVPSGLLRRCMPRTELLAHLHSVNSAEFTGHPEALACLLELMAALASVKFVGAAYTIELSPLILEAAFRDPLVGLNEDAESPKLLSQSRATIAAMRVLQLYVLLRQPWQGAFCPTSLSLNSNRGLALLSQHLRQPKPRLTHDQWDALLCMTASWATQAAVKSSSSCPIFCQQSFMLVAAVGALFVNSICASVTVSTALIRRDSGLVSELFEAEDLEDASTFDLPEDCDCEDDGSVPAAEIDWDTWADEEDLAEDAEELMLSQTDESTFRRLSPPSFVQKDWSDFFASNLFGCLIPLALENCLGVGADTPSYLSALCAAVATCNADHFLECIRQQPALVASFILPDSVYGSSSLPTAPRVGNLLASECLLSPNLRNALDLALRLLTDSANQSGQLLGHILLTRLFCSRSLQPARRMADLLVPHLPPSLVRALTARLPNTLESCLADPDLTIAQWGRGTRTDLLPCQGDDHRNLLAYLMAWDAVVSLLSAASHQSRAGLQSALLSDETWMRHLCRLLLTLGLLLPSPCMLANYVCRASRLEPDPRLLLQPSSVAASRQQVLTATVGASRRPLESTGATVSNPLKAASAGDSAAWCDVFVPTDPLLALSGHRRAGDLSHLATRLLRRLLAESPALMRCLQSALLSGDCLSGSGPGERVMTPGQARQLAGHLDRLVRRYFSPNLIATEVCRVERRALHYKSKFGTTSYADELPEAGNVDVKGRPLSREVVTLYHFSSDQSLEMVIKLPENFPLAPVTVEAGQKIVAPTSNWRSWVLHLSVFINNQNGSILEGIGLWLRNLKKKFDGVEECAICYSVISDRNFTFPRMQCRVCKKRFHHDCMYRFFQTSRNPTCPLCRSLFFPTPS